MPTPASKLWQFQTGSGINAQPITWTHNGRQYVTVLSGIGGLCWNIAREQLKDKVPQGGSVWTFALLPDWSSTGEDMRWKSACRVKMRGHHARWRRPSSGRRLPLRQPQSPVRRPSRSRTGAELFAVNCSPCHGPRMQAPKALST